MQALFQRIALVAAADVPVLITGESGTGKELVARALHRYGSRRDGPFVPSLPAGLEPEPGRGRAIRPRQGGVHRRDRRTAKGSSSWPTAGPSCSTRSATPRRRSRSSCSGRSRTARSRRSATPGPGRSTSGCSPRPIAPCPRWSPRARSARTSISASPPSRSRSRRFASGPKTSPPWPRTSCRGFEDGSSRASLTDEVIEALQLAPLAGQRPGATERDRARRDPRPRRPDPSRAPARNPSHPPRQPGRQDLPGSVAAWAEAEAARGRAGRPRRRPLRPVSQGNRAVLAPSRPRPLRREPSRRRPAPGDRPGDAPPEAAAHEIGTTDRIVPFGWRRDLGQDLVLTDRRHPVPSWLDAWSGIPSRCKHRIVMDPGHFVQ